jgi:hypothetical protein
MTRTYHERYLRFSVHLAVRSRANRSCGEGESSTILISTGGIRDETLTGKSLVDTVLSSKSRLVPSADSAISWK